MVLEHFSPHERVYLLIKYEALKHAYLCSTGEPIISQRLVNIRELCVKGGSNWNVFIYYCTDMDKAWRYYSSGQYRREHGTKKKLIDSLKAKFASK